MEAVRHATSRCPFLRNVAETSGETFAEHIAVQPEQPFFSHQGTFSLSACPLAGLKATFRKFHDPDAGVVPLQQERFTQVEARVIGCSCRGACSCKQAHSHPTSSGAARQPEAVCPFASISLAGLPGPDHFLRKWLRQRQLDKQARRQGQPGGPGSSGSQPAGSSSGRAGPVRGHGSSLTGPRTACTSGRPPGISSPPRSKKQQKGTSGSGRIPYWKKYGPLGGLVPLGVKGELACPPAIVAARAFVAGLPPVQELRPKALHVKMASIALVAAAANVPFGAWREHFDKFSFGWFVAVHATIPFIALLRKGVVMPRWAILLTISGALVGQTIGSRLERRRLAAPAATEHHEALSRSRPIPLASIACIPPLHQSDDRPAGGSAMFGCEQQGLGSQLSCSQSHAQGSMFFASASNSCVAV